MFEVEEHMSEEYMSEEQLEWNSSAAAIAAVAIVAVVARRETANLWRSTSSRPRS